MYGFLSSLAFTLKCHPLLLSCVHSLLAHSTSGAYVCTCVYVCMRVRVCMYVCMYVCVCTSLSPSLPPTLSRPLQILKPFTLRRLKQDVEKALADKIETNLYVTLTALQKKWYKSLLENDAHTLLAELGSRSKSRMLNTLMQLRKCCNHPYLFDGVEPGPPYTNGLSTRCLQLCFASDSSPVARVTPFPFCCVFVFVSLFCLFCLFLCSFFLCFVCFVCFVCFCLCVCPSVQLQGRTCGSRLGK